MTYRPPQLCTNREHGVTWKDESRLPRGADWCRVCNGFVDPQEIKPRIALDRLQSALEILMQAVDEKCLPADEVEPLRAQLSILIEKQKKSR